LLRPFTALADLIVSFIRADVPMREIDPYRRAGADAYDLIDQVPPASWARVAAWNAFLLQAYGDNLIAEGARGRYCAPELAMFAQRLYQEANVWLEEVHKAQASAAYRFRFTLPHPLPHWAGYRADEHLRAMRRTAETGRTRVASDLERFAGDDTYRDLLRVRLAEIDSEILYVERLWTKRPTEELRRLVGETLQIALDHAYEIGQLLAQPELIVRLYTRR
jgi:hypothetical protein